MNTKTHKIDINKIEKQVENYFFDNKSLDKNFVESSIKEALHSFNDGELYMESVINECYFFEQNNLKNFSSNLDEGYGIRGIDDEAISYVHSSLLDKKSFSQAVNDVKELRKHLNSNKIVNKNIDDKNNIDKNNIDKNNTQKNNTQKNETTKLLYSINNPIKALEQTKKIKLIEEINKYLRDKDNRVIDVSISIVINYKQVFILKHDLSSQCDIRPLTRINISVLVQDKEGRRERASYGAGGRGEFLDYLSQTKWQYYADEALRVALLNLKAQDAPAGEMDVVLGNGWTGVLLHEAVGHGLEADFNYKKTSVFSNLMGEKVADDSVTVIDDGTIEQRRGSIRIDDEGENSRHNVLIENGVLKSYMTDRMYGNLMKTGSTGNGRRESYKYHPMPRMTNTFMTNGKHQPEEMIENVKNGIYAVNFSGGQVDITSGNFVFSASESYIIKNGKLSDYPVRGMTLIGNGAKAMKNIKMVGNDTALDSGIGTCGKEGQSVPVGVGMPSVLMNNMTVGGTSLS